MKRELLLPNKWGQINIIGGGSGMGSESQ